MGIFIAKQVKESRILIQLVIVALITAGIFADTSSNVMQSVFPAYAIASNAEILGKSGKCREELELLRDGVDCKKLWSLRVLDSSGEPSSGFLYGNNYWTGSKNQCYDTRNSEPLALHPKVLKKNSLYRNPDEELAPFELNYFSAYFFHNSKLQYHVRIPGEDLIILGLCLPASCTTNDLEIILKKIFEDKMLLTDQIYGMNFKLLYVKDFKDDVYEYLKNWRMITVVVTIVCSLLTIIAATFYDVCVYQQRKKVGTVKTVNHKDKKNMDVATNLIPAVNEKNVTSEEVSGVDNKRLKSIPASIPGEKLTDALLCFSAYSNSKDIFDTSKSNDSIESLHGIRFLSMTWLVLCHGALFGKDYINNKVWAYRFITRLVNRIFVNVALAVDTFFFMSGFLLAYTFFKSEKKSRNTAKHIPWADFFRRILKRFIRLTPAYMIIIGIAELILAGQTSTSSFYIHDKPQDTCSKYWWRNLLYINNLFKRSEMCLYWSYYLSNDMQFFITGLFLLFLSRRYRNTAAVLCVTLFLTSTVYTGYTIYDYDYVPTIDEQLNKMEKFYDPPWIRIGSYIVGLVTAYFLTRLNGKLVLKKSTLCLLWIFGSSCNLITLFGPYHKQLSIVPMAIYLALHKIIWSVGIAWIVIVCTTNPGGIVSKILSSKIWLPLSKMTYCVYLLNPLIIHFVFLNNESAVHMDFIPFAIFGLGVVLVSNLCAYIFSLMFEVPYIRLFKLYVK